MITRAQQALTIHPTACSEVPISDHAPDVLSSVLIETPDRSAAVISTIATAPTNHSGATCAARRWARKVSTPIMRSESGRAQMGT